MSHRILIVDDEPNIIGTVSSLLRTRGYDVLSAMTGRAALDTTEREKPDLIILDLGLPDMDGVEVIRRVREWSQVPIIVLSVKGEERSKVVAKFWRTRLEARYQIDAAIDKGPPTAQINAALAQDVRTGTIAYSQPKLSMTNPPVMPFQDGEYHVPRHHFEVSNLHGYPPITSPLGEFRSVCNHGLDQRHPHGVFESGHRCHYRLLAQSTHTLEFVHAHEGDWQHRAGS